MSDAVYAAYLIGFALVYVVLIALFTTGAARRRTWNEIVFVRGVGYALWVVIWAAIAVVLLASTFYTSLSVRSASAFSEPLTWLDAFYFAMSVFTTTGLGDIAPVSNLARALVATQMVLGFGVITFGLGAALTHIWAGRDPADVLRPPREEP